MLTLKKKKFAEALHRGLNQREAAIDAGYSENSARVKGSQLAADPDVRKYLQMLTGGINIPHPDNVTDDVTESDLKDAIKVMTLIMTSNITTDPKLALDAAAKLAPYTHRKLDAVGKKERKAEFAEAAIHRFAPLPVPNLKH
ncbi:terminase small subunit [Proteus mirabilis]|uniref:terminase small subunit n=1 Tax=Proteus mirabilis TaxID=584 RepID=UPI003F1DBBBC